MSLNNISTTLIYPKINVINQYSNIILIDSSVQDYEEIYNSVNSSTLPIVYSWNTSQLELNNLLESYFTKIDRIALCFMSTLSNYNIFLDNKTLFTEEDVVNNQEKIYSDNVNWLINTIKNFHVKNIDFFACEILKKSIWVLYFELLMSETDVIVGASDNKTGNIKYGGDWIMESTNEDISNIYFTNDIQIYQYLFDKTSWSTGYDSNYTIVGMTMYENNLYIPNNESNSISQTDISTGTNNIWLDGFSNNTSGITNFGNYLYVSNYSKNAIVKIDLSTNLIISRTWATVSAPKSIAIDSSGNYLYVVSGSNIIKINMSDDLLFHLIHGHIYSMQVK